MGRLPNCRYREPRTTSLIFEAFPTPPSVRQSVQISLFGCFRGASAAPNGENCFRAKSLKSWRAREDFELLTFAFGGQSFAVLFIMGSRRISVQNCQALAQAAASS